MQRNMLAQYHVTNPQTSTGQRPVGGAGGPGEQGAASSRRTGCRCARRHRATSPVFSLTSVYVPHEPAEPRVVHASVGLRRRPQRDYGKIRILRLPDNTQIHGPSQIANTFAADARSSSKLLPLHADQLQGALRQPADPAGRRRSALRAAGLHPAADGGRRPTRCCATCWSPSARRSGIGTTLAGALNDVLGASVLHRRPDGRHRRHRRAAGVPTVAALLQQAQAKFTEAQRALQRGDLQGYAAAQAAARTTWSRRSR